MRSPSRRSSNALEILIADDDELLCARLELLLAARGLHALSVNSLTLAREAMRAVYFPVVILDRDLGDGDGADLCREYKAKQAERRVRILMLSGRNAGDEVQRAREAGADEFVSKQDGEDAIVERICRLHSIACQRLPDDVSTDAEAARLRALAECAILDTAAEAAFDDITLIASTLFKTPIAAISLIDASRQWFKSKVGIAAVETPRQQAFCTHAVTNPEQVLVVPDARCDARFADNPFVTSDPQIRFYAGAPIVTSDGFALGTVCVVDTQPRDLSTEERQALQALARQVVTLLEQRRARKEFEAALTAQRSAEDELRRREALLRNAYENAPIGKALVSLAGQWLQVNRSICEIVGYSANELLQTTFQAITHPEDLETDLGHVRDMLAGKIRRYEMEKRYIHKEGHIVWVLLSVSLVRDEKDAPVFFVAEVQDITLRKGLERSKEEFFAVLSHELRTPVTALRASLGLLTDRVGDALPPEAQSLFDLSLRSADRLQRLIGDILDLEKIENGTFRYEQQQVDADELLTRAIEEMQPDASESNVRLFKMSASCGLQLQADRDRILQVLTNLISNALKHSPAGSRVDVCAAPMRSTVRFSVTDRGPGIPQELHALMFKKYAQANAKNSKRKGPGNALGLSICKAIVEGHEGTLSFRTSELGSTFFFDLPRLRA